MAGHEEDTLPYKAPGYDWWAVPMHSVWFDDEWVAFCDNPFKSRTDAATWGELLKSELDSMHGQDRPLLVEVHPYYTGVDDAAFEAFAGFLDYAQAKGARFLSAASVVSAWGQAGQEDSPQAASDGCACTDD